MFLGLFVPGLVVLLLFGYSFLSPASLFLRGLDNEIHDRMLRWSANKPYSENLHFLAINRPSYESEVGSTITEEEMQSSEPLRMMKETFPWNRAVWGHAIERLIEDGGADVVVLDLLLESSSPGDTYLRTVMNEHSEDVVTASRIDVQNFGDLVKRSYSVPSESVLGPNPKQEGFLSDTDGRLGHVNVFADSIDGVIRTITYEHEWPGDEENDTKIIPALAARTLMKSDAFSYEPKEEHYTRRIRFSGPPSTYSPRPIYQLFVDSLWEANFSGDNSVEGDIVVIGPFGNWQQDYKETPISDELMPGPELHLNAIAALQKQAFLEQLSDWWDLFLVIVLGLVSMVIFLVIGSTYLQFGLFLAVGAGYLAGVFGVFEIQNIVAPVVFPLLAYVGNGLTIFGYQYFRERREKQRIRGTLDRYISSKVASEILENREDYLGALGGERKDVTVLFSDIRSFTPISEQLEPERLVNQLNQFLTPMTEIIQDRKGRLDKFIGDAIMAVWGDLFDRLRTEEEVVLAVEAALEMLERTEELNEKWEKEGFPTFEIGIGINRGRAVFGNLGAESRMEMTVIGDAVNQAARFEGLTKTYGISLIVGDGIHDHLPEEFVSFRLDSVRVKGKTEPTDVYGVLGKRGFLPEDVLESIRRFENARDLYSEGHFEEARDHFSDLEQNRYFGQSAQLYEERIRDLLADPPEDWDGVWVMQSK